MRESGKALAELLAGLAASETTPGFVFQQILQSSFFG